MLKHRWFHKIKARMGGYFWLPCPRCGQMMGGHEISALMDRNQGKLIEVGEYGRNKDPNCLPGHVIEVDQHGRVIHRWATCPECPGDEIKHTTVGIGERVEG